ncbi:MAG: hypothetical protein M3014_07315 [Chloroflexota bacterium]|nr:hypothetical protein [Chloroflexota bacterium]
MGPIENEFDPTIYAADYVTAGVEEPISLILDKVEGALLRSPNVVLIIPRGSQAFHTTHDFLALGKLQGGREVRVSIASPDPTIAGLARVLGFHIAELPSDHPAVMNDPAPGRMLDESGEKPTSPLPLRADGKVPEWVLSQSQPTYSSSTLTTSAWLSLPGDVAYDGQPPMQALPHLSQPLPRPGMPPPRTRPRQTGQLLTGALPTGTLPRRAEIPGERISPAASLVSPTPSGRIKARRVVAEEERTAVEVRKKPGLFRPRNVFATLMVMLLLALAGGGFYAYTYLPEGTINVTPLNKPISALPVQVMVLTTQQGQQGAGKAGGVAVPPNQQQDQTNAGALTLTASAIQAPISEEGTHQATGTRRVLHGRGTGTMHFTNTTGNPVVVAIGMAFKGPNGVTVKTTQSGIVPPTIFDQHVFGTTDLPIAATVDGPDGNIGQGQLAGNNGRLDYTNSALVGGTTETIKVVTQKDIDSILADLRQKADNRVGGAILEVVSSGQQLITQTVSLTDVAFDPDHKAGDDGESVHVRLTAVARAYVFKEGELHDTISQAVLNYVGQEDPIAGPTLDLSSIQYDPPTILSLELDKGRVVYATSANARVSYTLTPSLATRIRDLVKGQNLIRARSLIMQSYGNYVYVSPSQIDARVLWFSINQLPGDPARIQVEPSGSAPEQPVQQAPRTTDPRTPH